MKGAIYIFGILVLAFGVSLSTDFIDAENINIYWSAGIYLATTRFIIRPLVYKIFEPKQKFHWKHFVPFYQEISLFPKDSLTFTFHIISIILTVLMCLLAFVVPTGFYTALGIKVLDVQNVTTIFTFLMILGYISMCATTALTINKKSEELQLVESKGFLGGTNTVMDMTARLLYFIPVFRGVAYIITLSIKRRQI